MKKKRKKTLVRRYTSIAYLLDALSRQELTLLDPKSWADKNDSFFVDLYRQYRGVHAVFASCCTLSSETFHHWYVFGGSSAGAFIEYDRESLEDCLRTRKTEGHLVRFAAVKYFTLKRVKSEATLQNLPFAKRWGFQAEKEYRVIAETDNDEMLTYPLSVPISAVRRVVINPWLPEAVVRTIRAQIHSIKDVSR